MSDVIDRIVVRCIKQQDSTGSDSLNLSLNGVLKRIQEPIVSGQTRTFSRGMFNTTLWVEPGDRLRIEEFDHLVPNDVLLDHSFTAAEISSGKVTLRDSLSSAEYEFEIYFEHV